MVSRVIQFDGSSRSLEAWDGFVSRHALATIGHLSTNFHFVEPRANTSLMAVNDEDRLVGILPLFETSGRELRVFRRRILLSGPEFPAGPLVDEKLPRREARQVLRMLLESAQAAAMRRRVDEIRISYPAVAGQKTVQDIHRYLPLRHYGYRESSLVVLLLDLGCDQMKLFENLAADCRNKIRRAERGGLTVRSVGDRTEWMSFYDLNVQTLGALSDTRSQMEVIWDRFVDPGLARVSVVDCDETPVNVVVTVGYGTSSYYWKSYRDQQRNVRGANNLGLWRAILEARSKGFQFFELGGMEFVNKKQMAISTFKESFGGTPVYQFRGTRQMRPVRRALLDLAAAGIGRWRA